MRLIAKDYAAKPEDTIIVSPDNRSRQEINQAARTELQARGAIAPENETFQTLNHRSDITGADRAWAVRYQPGNVVQYTTGSKELGIERGSSATVLSTSACENTVTVEKRDGRTVTYNPQRLRGVNVFETTQREFATGDRLQFTAPDKQLGIVRRELGTVQRLGRNEITVKLDGKDGRIIVFDSKEFRSFDHGYAVTSHSAQGLTTGRVLVNIDADGPRSLVNSRLAYVAVSRAAHEAQIYTNDARGLAAALSTEHSKTSAVEFRNNSPTKETNHHTHQQHKPEPATAKQAPQLQQPGPGLGLGANTQPLKRTHGPPKTPS